MEVSVKKAVVFVILVLAVGAVMTGCDQQKALDQILQNPEMKAYMMTKMMGDAAIKEEITTQLLADTAWVSEIVTKLADQMSNREMMMNTLLSHEGMGEMMLEKMSEDPQLKDKMKEIGKRR